MERRLLLISDENGFLLKSIRMNFIRQGFVVTDARASSKDIELKQSQNAVFFLFLDAEVNANAMAWRYIRSLCERNEKKLIAYGSQEEIDNLARYIPEEDLSFKYLRPTDMRKMTTEIESLYSGFGVDNRKNILLVDDDPTYLHMLGGALLDAYNVSMAKSGEQALSYLESNTMPDLILLDYEMPGMSGTEVLDKIRNNRRTEDIPVVFLTGKNDSDTVMQVLSKRPDGYLLKTSSVQQITDYLTQFFIKLAKADETRRGY